MKLILLVIAINFSLLLGVDSCGEHQPKFHTEICDSLQHVVDSLQKVPAQVNIINHYDTVVVHDTISIPAKEYNKKYVDSLRTALFLANQKVSAVQYYIKIVKHNPKQGKFLLGWVNRAVN